MARRNSSTAISTAPTSPVLPDEVAALYEIPAGRVAVFLCADFGMVDLRKIDLAFAAKLAEKGYLKSLDRTDP